MLPYFILVIEDEDDRQFMTNLYYSYGRLILAEIRKIINDPWEADDIFQTTLEKLMARLDLLKNLERRQLINYIITAAKHNSVSFLRRSKRVPVDPLDENGGPADSSAYRAESAEDVVINMEQFNRIVEIWPMLSSKNRYLLEAKYILGLTNQEIADSLQIKLDSVRMELSRARKQVRDLLKNIT